jgi:hypothetical protein
VLTGLKPGTRLTSPVGDVEVIVIKAPSSEIDLRCGGKPMLLLNAERPAGATAEPGFDQGTQIGKRYVDESMDLEVLCTKGGPSSLSIGETLLQIKEAKPLPSSD